MSENKVNSLLGVSMDKIKEMVDVNTVIGDPITAPDGTTVIPVSRVSYGFAGGGTEEKPVGLVYIALSDGKNTWVAKRQPMGRLKSREWHRHCAASKALDMVRRYLAGLPVDEA